MPREDPLIEHETKLLGAKVVQEIDFCSVLGAEAVNKMPVVSLGRNIGTSRTQMHRDCLFVCRYIRAALYLF